jgi:hypothetical protein
MRKPTIDQRVVAFLTDDKHSDRRYAFPQFVELATGRAPSVRTDKWARYRFWKWRYLAERDNHHLIIAEREEKEMRNSPIRFVRPISFKNLSDPVLKEALEDSFNRVQQRQADGAQAYRMARHVARLPNALKKKWVRALLDRFERLDNVNKEEKDELKKLLT